MFLLLYHLSLSKQPDSPDYNNQDMPENQVRTQRWNLRWNVNLISICIYFDQAAAAPAASGGGGGGGGGAESVAALTASFKDMMRKVNCAHKLSVIEFWGL